MKNSSIVDRKFGLKRSKYILWNSLGSILKNDKKSLKMLKGACSEKGQIAVLAAKMPAKVVGRVWLAKISPTPKILAAKIKDLAAKMGGPGPRVPNPILAPKSLVLAAKIFGFGGIFASQTLPTTLAGILAGKMVI